MPIHLHNMIRITVGQLMAIYKCVQLFTRCANTGKSITPIDQNVSNNVIMIVFGFPAVISETSIILENRNCKTLELGCVCVIVCLFLSALTNHLTGRIHLTTAYS